MVLSSIKQKSLSIAFAAAVLSCTAGMGVAQANTLDEAAMASMNQACAVASERKISQTEASSCVTPFYTVAMDKAAEIKKALSSSNIDSTAIRSAIHNFEAICDKQAGSDFMLFKNAESYLRKPQHCLSMLSDTAERYDVDFDKEGTAFLISRLRQLRHLDLQP